MPPPSPARQGKATEQQPPQPPQPPPQEEEEARLPPLPTKPHYAPIFEFLAVLGEYDNFTMAALVSPQVRFCRYRFSATGDLGYRGVRGAEC